MLRNVRNVINLVSVKPQRTSVSIAQQIPSNIVAFRQGWSGRSFYSWNSVQRYRKPVGGEQAVYGLLALNAAGWMAWRTHPKLMHEHFVVSEGRIRAGRWHTLLTACFSHQSTGHLIGNMFTLYFFGRSLASTLGAGKFVRLYCLGGIVGNIVYLGFRSLQHSSYVATLTIDTITRIPVSVYRYDPGALGASGSVNSVVVCQILMAPTATVLLYGFLPLPAWLMGVAWIGLDVLGTIRDTQGVNVGGTAFQGHLGGATIGVLAYMRWRRGRPF